MPLIEYPSSDGATIFRAEISEGDSGCEIKSCTSRPVDVLPDAGTFHQVPPPPGTDLPEQAAADEQPKRTNITLAKAHKFLRAWATMMKQGAVSERVYRYRRGLCEGVDGVNPPCPHNTLADGGKHFCNQCGCGQRRYATLYIEGKPDDETERLWMPDPQCPVLAMRPMRGSGTLKSVGGRIKQLKKLLAAGKDEMKHAKVSESDGSGFIKELGDL